MSDTIRNTKTWPRERLFPYIPRGVQVVSTGRANSAEDNKAYVRTLLSLRQPYFAAKLENAIKEIQS